MKISAPKRQGFSVEISRLPQNRFDLLTSIDFNRPSEVTRIAVTQNTADDKIGVTRRVWRTDIPE